MTAAGEDVDNPNPKEWSNEQLLSIAQNARAVSKLSPFRDEELQGRRQDREQRLKHARACFGLMGIQLLFLNGLMVCVGFKWMTFDPGLVLAYMTGTFGEVVAIVIVITAYLFPRPAKQAPETK